MRATPARGGAGGIVVAAVASPVAASFASSSRAVVARGARIESVDLLRGIVMVIMALDHVRDYLSSASFNPLDLERTTLAYYATRWVTHFAAPVFVLLAGTSAYLQLQRGKTPRELSRFLLTRGLWLVALELTVITFAWNFNLNPVLDLGVIWAIGLSMVALAGLVFLPPRAVLAAGVGIVALHNALDPVPAAAFGAAAPAWMLLHEPGVILLPGGWVTYVTYPLLPWVGIMAAGFGLGVLYDRPAEERRRALVGLGLGALALFFALRATQAYGEANAWTDWESALWTALDFMDVTKYPPSLLFTLVTLGPSLLALAALEKARGWSAGFFLVFGRVPLFYYVTHLYLAHLLAVALAALTGFGAGAALVTFYMLPPGFGTSLPFVYLAWVGLVLVLYAPCRWFGEVKRRNPDKRWLSYL